ARSGSRPGSRSSARSPRRFGTTRSSHRWLSRFSPMCCFGATTCPPHPLNPTSPLGRLSNLLGNLKELHVVEDRARAAHRWRRGTARAVPPRSSEPVVSPLPLGRFEDVSRDPRRAAAQAARARGLAARGGRRG